MNRIFPKWLDGVTESEGNIYTDGIDRNSE